MDGSFDSTVNRPLRPLTIWFREPRDISTARTSAWSPPTRAWETLRATPVVWAPPPGIPGLGVKGPPGRIGWPTLPLAPLLPLPPTHPHRPHRHLRPPPA